MNQVYDTRRPINYRDNAEFLHRISNSLNPSRSDISLRNLVVLPPLRKPYSFSFEDDKYKLEYLENKNCVTFRYHKKNSTILDIVSKLTNIKKKQTRLPPLKEFP
jgi:hypothetical protein